MTKDNEGDKYVEGKDFKWVTAPGSNYKTRKFFTKAEKEAMKAPKKAEKAPAKKAPAKKTTAPETSPRPKAKPKGQLKVGPAPRSPKTMNNKGLTGAGKTSGSGATGTWESALPAGAAGLAAIPAWRRREIKAGAKPTPTEMKQIRQRPVPYNPGGDVAKAKTSSVSGASRGTSGKTATETKRIAMQKRLESAGKSGSKVSLPPKARGGGSSNSGAPAAPKSNSLRSRVLTALRRGAPIGDIPMGGRILSLDDKLERLQFAKGGMVKKKKC